MLMLDTEVYKNYFLLMFKEISSGKTKHFELTPGNPSIDIKSITNLLKTRTIITFNGNSFDMPIIAGVLKGFDNAKIKKLCDEIIKSKTPAYKLIKQYQLNLPKCDHIDLIEVAPGQSSLKIYGGRLHCKTMQDFPIAPEAEISQEQHAELREYCKNDLDVTELLYNKLKPQIELRAEMSKQYSMDLRSKSDAQIAETIITSELTRTTGKQYRKPENPAESFNYKDPEIIDFYSDELANIFYTLLKDKFTLGVTAAVNLPEALKDKRIKIGQTEYKMGIGGLHSCEESQYVVADDNHLLIDLDVASYYPSIILQQNLAPESMGKPFLQVYQGIVDRRIKAKRAGDKVTADVLKIAVNGSFGKLGSKYSALYAPELLIQTTITGQLALLMLIERIEMAGMRVISANTDGIVIYLHKNNERQLEEIAFDWTLDTSFELERTDYKSIASRDVNSYCAVKLDEKTKCKGVFAGSSLAKNPDNEIVAEAVSKKLSKNIDIEFSIRECKDITKFVSIRRVQGGATWKGQYLGKAVRFYHSSNIEQSCTIQYATNSNTVPKSQGTRPLMTLGEFPEDIDYDYYIKEATDLLREVGYA